jgi:hypothetical protein
MFYKLFIFSLLLIHFKLAAQTAPDNNLYNLYQQQGKSALFENLDSLKDLRKINIKAEISGLPETVLSFSLFNEFKTTGNRVNYGNNYLPVAAN